MLDKEQFAARQRDLVTAPRWIIDGNYASTLPIRLQAAGTVVFLDLPAWACLWGIIQRRLRHGSGQHVAIGVYDRITGNFFRFIAEYRRQMARRVRQLIQPQAARTDLESSPAATATQTGHPAPPACIAVTNLYQATVGKPAVVVLVHVGPFTEPPGQPV